MKVVIAIDSFKGSLSSIDAADAVAKGILKVDPEAIIVKKPLADGGEGTVDGLTEGMGGTLVYCDVTGPLGDVVQAKYGIVDNLAIMEMAQASGLTLVPEEKRNPLNTTSYGVGEMIKHALDNGISEFIIGIGGSATNDGGIGMLSALGIKFLDKNGNVLSGYGRDLEQINSIDVRNIDPRISNCKFEIACDVDNPLCGKRGASYIYGPQKGASPEVVEQLDKAMQNYANLSKLALAKDFENYSGAGAAGGLGYAFKCYLEADLKPGIQIVMDKVNIEEDLKDADLLITGEGRLDAQTAMGKAPVGVAKLAKKYDCDTVALSGIATYEAGIVNEHGIDAYFTILQQLVNLEEAMKTEVAAQNLQITAEQVYRLWNLNKK
ncbi:MAG: glycerate kinase [Christensenellaceae bacterium]|nr:glycerate kinase [Christensenellaceae bacterium]